MLKRRKPRVREETCSAQDPTARKRQCWDLTPDFELIKDSPILVLSSVSSDVNWGNTCPNTQDLEETSL